MQSQSSLSQIFPIPQIIKAQLEYKLADPNISTKLTFKHSPKQHVKYQFRLIKRINGFDVKDKKIINILNEALPSLFLQGHLVKEISTYRTSHLKLLEYNWLQLIEEINCQLIVQVSTSKPQNHLKNLKQQTIRRGIGIQMIHDHFSKVDKILKNLRQKKKIINSVEFSCDQSQIGWIFGSGEPKNLLRIQNELLKSYTLRKISILNIQYTSNLFLRFDDFLHKNKQLQEIHYQFTGLAQSHAPQYYQIFQTINPTLPEFRFFRTGEVLFQKIYKNFEIIELQVCGILECIISEGFLSNYEKFSHLKSLAIDTIYSEHSRTANFTLLRTLFERLTKIQNLESCVLKFSKQILEGSQLCELGSLIGNCNRLKYFSMEIREEIVEGFDQCSFLNSALQNNNTLESIQLNFLKFPTNNSYKANLEPGKQKELYQNLSLKEINLQIEPLRKNDFMIENVKHFISCQLNLSSIYLTLQHIEFESGAFENISERFVSLKQIKKICIYTWSCTFSNQEEIFNFWEYINRCQLLQSLSLSICGEVKSKSENLQGEEGVISNIIQSKNEKLEKLSLYFDVSLLEDISIDSITNICSQVNKNLNEFEFTAPYKNVTLNEVAKIGGHIMAFKNLRSLVVQIRESFMKDDALIALFDGIGQCSKLNYLNLMLDSNEITLQAFSVSNFLNQCYQLEILKLNLSSNQIDNDGALKLCKSISLLPSLKSLYLNLNGNKIPQDSTFYNILEGIWKKCITYREQDRFL